MKVSNYGTSNRSQRAERDIVGSILIDESCFDIVYDILKPSDFYTEVARVVYSTMCELRNSNRPVDMVSILSVIGNNPVFLQAGGVTYLTNSMSSLPTASQVVHFCKIVRSESVYRKLLNFSDTMKAINWGEVNDPDSEVARLCEEMSQITSATAVTPWKEFRTALQDTYNNLVNYKEGETNEIKTGFIDLDAKLNLKPGALTVVAARPAMGKTAFGLNIMSHVAFNLKKPVAFFSLEMTAEELINRVISSLASVNGNAIRHKKLTDDEWKKLLDVAEVYVNAPIYIDETPGIDIAVLRERARRMKRQYGIQCLIVDYLQLMHADGKKILNRENEVATISRGLKGIAKELSIPVIALAQLNRALDSRADKHPILSDLRESGSIEQDSDNILFLHREDYYKTDESEKDNQAEVIIAKQRSGPTGMIKLYWESDFTRFSNLDPYH